jgi:hypothetical protein
MTLLEISAYLSEQYGVINLREYVLDVLGLGTSKGRVDYNGLG